MRRHSFGWSWENLHTAPAVHGTQTHLDRDRVRIQVRDVGVQAHFVQEPLKRLALQLMPQGHPRRRVARVDPLEEAHPGEQRAVVVEPDLGWLVGRLVGWSVGQSVCASNIRQTTAEEM